MLVVQYTEPYVSPVVFTNNIHHIFFSVLVIKRHILQFVSERLKIIVHNQVSDLIIISYYFSDITE